VHSRESLQAERLKGRAPVPEAQLATLTSPVGELIHKDTHLGQVDAADALLVSRCQAGDADAWHVFVDRYQDHLYNTAYGFVQNHNEADDLAQEAFIAVYKALPSFRGDSRLQTWLYRITVNVCLQAIRRRKPATAPLPDEHSDMPVKDEALKCHAGPEDLSVRQEARRQVRRMVARLPVKFREVVVLCDLQDLPYEETAEVLGISIGTVRSRLHRGRNRLKDLLQDYFAEMEGAA